MLTSKNFCLDCLVFAAVDISYSLSLSHTPNSIIVFFFFLDKGKGIGFDSAPLRSEVLKKSTFSGWRI